MINWLAPGLIGIFLLYCAITRADDACIRETGSGKEFSQGRDVHARSPWNAFPDYYL
jgi:hypothetical protein